MPNQIIYIMSFMSVLFFILGLCLGILMRREKDEEEIILCPYPCTKCGKPSMKDATRNPVEYECFECSHRFTRNEPNRRVK